MRLKFGCSRLKLGGFCVCFAGQKKKVRMPVEYRPRMPRPAPPPDPEWGVLQIAPPSGIATKTRAICCPFGHASTVDRVRTFKLLCAMCVRLLHACVESHELFTAWPPVGEDVRRDAAVRARPHVPSGLDVLSPHERMGV